MPLKRDLFDFFLTLLRRTLSRWASALGEVGSARVRRASLQHRLKSLYWVAALHGQDKQTQNSKANQDVDSFAKNIRNV